MRPTEEEAYEIHCNDMIMLNVKDARPFQGRNELGEAPLREMTRAPAHPDEARVIQSSMFRFNIQPVANAGFGEQIFRLR